MNGSASPLTVAGSGPYMSPPASHVATPSR